MASWKIRSQVLMPNSLQVGSNGTKFDKFLFGLGSACVPAMNASSIGTGSLAITGVAAGDTVIVQLASQGASGIGIMAASSITNGASLTFFALGGATGASTMVFNYIAVSPS